MPDCSSLIVSEETGDYIIEYNSLYFEQIQRQDGVCISCINDTWCILYTNYPGSRNINIQQGYYSVPKLYGLMDTTSFDASGITATLNQPLLNVRGQGVLIGFLDTGIDYLREDFKASGGRTRIAAVWDQTIQSVNYEEDTGEAAGTEQYDREQVQGMVQYGTVYTREDINAALAAEREGQNPYDIVPSRDEDCILERFDPGNSVVCTDRAIHCIIQRKDVRIRICGIRMYRSVTVVGDGDLRSGWNIDSVVL